MCTSKLDSECTKKFLQHEVIERISTFEDICPEDCTIKHYEIKERQDLVISKPSNISQAYFFWKSTKFAQEKEYHIYGFASILGSVGGSLGLFLGFSCRGFLNQTLDLLFNRYLK